MEEKGEENAKQQTMRSIFQPDVLQRGWQHKQTEETEFGCKPSGDWTGDKALKPVVGSVFLTIALILGKMLVRLSCLKWYFGLL